MKMPAAIPMIPVSRVRRGECRFHPCDTSHKQCTALDECCSDLCQILSIGTVCRPESVCQEQATCTGASGVCPELVPRNDGVFCGDGPLLEYYRCQVGRCESLCVLHHECDANEPCCSDYCQYEPATPPGQTESSCGGSSECAEAAVCTGLSGLCIGNAINEGQSCASPIAGKVAECNNGQCRAVCDLRGQCDSTTSPGCCDESTCQSYSDGTPCQAGSVTGTCIQGTCASPCGSEAQCVLGSQCCDSVCRFVTFGHVCHGKCIFLLHWCWNILDNTCSTVANVPGFCQTNGDCAADFCHAFGAIGRCTCQNDKDACKFCCFAGDDQCHPIAWFDSAIVDTTAIINTLVSLDPSRARLLSPIEAGESCLSFGECSSEEPGSCVLSPKTIDGPIPEVFERRIRWDNYDPENEPVDLFNISQVSETAHRSLGALSIARNFIGLFRR